MIIENFLITFEVLEIVRKPDDILEREKYWIHMLYKENPNLSLNIACTKGVVFD